MLVLASSCSVDLSWIYLYLQSTYNNGTIRTIMGRPLPTHEGYHRISIRLASAGKPRFFVGCRVEITSTMDVCDILPLLVLVGHRLMPLVTRVVIVRNLACHASVPATLPKLALCISLASNAFGAGSSATNQTGITGFVSASAVTTSSSAGACFAILLSQHQPRRWIT